MHWMKYLAEHSQSLRAAGSLSVASYCASERPDLRAHLLLTPTVLPQSSSDTFIRPANTLARACLVSPTGRSETSHRVTHIIRHNVVKQKECFLTTSLLVKYLDRIHSLNHNACV